MCELGVPCPSHKRGLAISTPTSSFPVRSLCHSMMPGEGLARPEVSSYFRVLKNSPKKCTFVGEEDGKVKGRHKLCKQKESALVGSPGSCSGPPAPASVDTGHHGHGRVSPVPSVAGQGGTDPQRLQWLQPLAWAPATGTIRGSTQGLQPAPPARVLCPCLVTPTLGPGPAP